MEWNPKLSDLPGGKSREACISFTGLSTAIIGTHHLRANQQGGGAHVCNRGSIAAAGQTGKGVARRMCEHSLEHARSRGFKAMQFNVVVSTSERAVRLWRSLGFETVGRLPLAFEHPRLGYVDALVMFRAL
ncbi:MAG: GNAT family N-acetyltransferase [Xanthobacteraceae bacterium]|nr:GNAT family N-acetyltransferase [Xanthobacteraceae bacterium]